MKIEIKDLYLYPLNSEELSLWLYDKHKLEEKLELIYSAEPLINTFKEVVNSQLILGLMESSIDWAWYTYWFIVKKNEKKVIGLIAFNGKPNNNNEVEIGYSLNSKYQHKGYMTNSILAICNWVKNNSTVKHVNAKTKINNFSSQRLLERCGFYEYFKDEISISFKKDL